MRINQTKSMTKRFGEAVAVDNVSIHVDQREISKVTTLAFARSQEVSILKRISLQQFWLSC
jgi:ABC-type uncharacterized transport system ATPase subunit